MYMYVHVHAVSVMLLSVLSLLLTVFLSVPCSAYIAGYIDQTYSIHMNDVRYTWLDHSYTA